MRKLRASQDPLASKAIHAFTHRVVREAGAMIGCLEGLDVIGFSGGIGEHDYLLRESVCERLSWLGVMLDRVLINAQLMMLPRRLAQKIVASKYGWCQQTRV